MFDLQNFTAFGFFDYAAQAKKMSFDSETFYEYLAYHDRQINESMKFLVCYFERFLNPIDIKKSLIFHCAPPEGYAGKMILKSGETVIRIFAKIDEHGNPLLKIGINDAVQKFNTKEGLISSLKKMEERFYQNRGEMKIASERTATDFQSALNEFLKYSRGLMQDYYDGLAKPDFKWHFLLEPSSGSKYIRLVSGSMILHKDDEAPKALSNYTSRSAWAFIDKTNGDILKPASCSSPAKHARANIYDKSTWKNVTSSGPRYM